MPLRGVCSYVRLGSTNVARPLVCILLLAAMGRSAIVRTNLIRPSCFQETTTLQRERSCRSVRAFPRGETGIRTLEARKGLTVFETAPFGHSGISPSLGLHCPRQRKAPAANSAKVRIFRGIEGRGQRLIGGSGGYDVRIGFTWSY